MKLVDVEYQFDGNKITFYFTSEGRIDFRELVKDLAGVFRTRIDLRQIGVRDEARRFDGMGMCGRRLCCATFLKDFEPVSLKMAKDQNLPLTPSKISGACGRLMCCLDYELEYYKDLTKDIPKIGKQDPGLRRRAPHREGRYIQPDRYPERRGEEPGRGQARGSAGGAAQGSGPREER